MTSGKTNHIKITYKLSWIKSFWHPVMVRWVSEDEGLWMKCPRLPITHQTHTHSLSLYSLVWVCSSRAGGHWRPSTLSLSLTSSPVSQDAVRTSTAFLIISLTFRGRLAKLSRLFVNAATWEKILKSLNRSIGSKINLYLKKLDIHWSVW